MKLVAQNYRSGDLEVVDVPPPACKPGGVLVRTLYSLISTGTEMMKVREARLSLVGKARARPDQVRKVLDTVAQVGPVAAYKKATARLDSLTPLGYSLCGRVIEVGSGVTDLAPAGSWPVPGTSTRCTARSTGCRPTCASLSRTKWNRGPLPSRPSGRSRCTACAVPRCNSARPRASSASGWSGSCSSSCSWLPVCGSSASTSSRTGAAGPSSPAPLACAGPTDADLELIERRLAATSVGGVDHVFLAAGGSSDARPSALPRVWRATRLGLSTSGSAASICPGTSTTRRSSTSASRGRTGRDGTTTGTSSMASTTRLATSAGRSVATSHASSTWSPPAWWMWSPSSPRSSRSTRPPRRTSASTLDHPRASASSSSIRSRRIPRSRPSASAANVVSIPTARRVTQHRGRDRAVRVGFVGAGNYASSALLPHLARTDGVELAHVVTTTSLSAANAAKELRLHPRVDRSGRALLDDDVDAVFVATRHHSHAELACRALERGKAVFVEKPSHCPKESWHRWLRVARSLQRPAHGRVQPALRPAARRSAPALRRVHVSERGALHRERRPPPSRQLVRERAARGFALVGEGGHFVDTVAWWLGARPVEVHTMRGPDPDDVQATLRFDDGSVAAITYVTGGNPRYRRSCSRSPPPGGRRSTTSGARRCGWAGAGRRTTSAWRRQGPARPARLVPGRGSSR